MNEKTNFLFLFRFVLLDKRKIDTSIDQRARRKAREEIRSFMEIITYDRICQEKTARGNI